MRIPIRRTTVVIMLAVLTGAAAPTRGDFQDTVSGEYADAAYNPTRDPIDSFVTITVASGEDDNGWWQTVRRQPIPTDVVITVSMFETLYARTDAGSLLRVETDEAFRSLETGIGQVTIELPQLPPGDARLDALHVAQVSGAGAIVPEPAILLLMLVGLPIVIARPRRAPAG